MQVAQKVQPVETASDSVLQVAAAPAARRVVGPQPEPEKKQRTYTPLLQQVNDSVMRSKRKQLLDWLVNLGWGGEARNAVEGAKDDEINTAHARMREIVGTAK